MKWTQGGRVRGVNRKRATCGKWKWTKYRCKHSNRASIDIRRTLLHLSSLLIPILLRPRHTRAHTKDHDSTVRLSFILRPPHTFLRFTLRHCTPPPIPRLTFRSAKRKFTGHSNPSGIHKISQGTSLSTCYDTILRSDQSRVHVRKITRTGLLSGRGWALNFTLGI